MIRKLLWIVFALATAAQGASPNEALLYPLELVPDQQEAQASRLAAEVLSRFHYKKVPIDDALSERVFDQYLKSLDAEKLIFLQSDIDRLAVYRRRLDDAIRKEDLAIPFAIFNLYQQRVTERFSYARTLLKTGFDFQEDESYQFVRDKAVWSNTATELHDLWRKRVKNDWLRLRLAGKDDANIVGILDKRYANFFKRIGQLKSADAFQTYMNAYTMAIEPHTNYMGPRQAEDFDISMRLSMVGIGAVLAEIDDYTTVRELVKGGPASLSGELNVGDRIVGVAQGEGGVMVDVMGWRLDDTVAIIRGLADSVVVLDSLPADAGPDGKRKLVKLVRKKISLEEQAAKKTIQTVADGKNIRRIGVISLATFYEDFEARKKGLANYKSATRDVARLLGELRKDKVDGLLIDLRNNGGGSLMEAIELTGLFIDKGPVVMQRNANNEITVGRDTQAGVAWDGPLGVLINRSSASASEIFAAAIQDYGRGVIIGEPSFGKGTVQTMVDLDQIAKNDKPKFGELKMTVAQFFRINGGTTQLRGVIPDILFPSVAGAGNLGESGFDNALPWTQIKPADYAPAGDLKTLLPLLLVRHEARVKKDLDFQYLREDITEFKRLREQNLLSLNETVRRKLRDTESAQIKLRDAQRNGDRGLAENPVDAVAAGDPIRRDDGLQPDERGLANELAAEKAQKNAKDVLLREAVHIVGDEVTILKTDASLAARVAPYGQKIGIY